MAHRMLELTLVSARDLKYVNLFSRMEVYGVVSICGDPRTSQRTKTDREGARHPTWDADHTLWFTVPPTAAAASASGARLHVLLRTERLFSFCDGDVGEVFIPLADLLAGACYSGAATALEYASFEVRKVQCAERRRGTLTLSYRFGPVIPPLVPVYQQQPWQCYPPPHAYYQVVYPPSFPRMLPGAGYGAAAYDDDAGYKTASADAGRIAV